MLMMDGVGRSQCRLLRGFTIFNVLQTSRQQVLADATVSPTTAGGSSCRDRPVDTMLGRGRGTLII